MKSVDNDMDKVENANGTFFKIEIHFSFYLIKKTAIKLHVATKTQ
jgi:hypothetical protein